jgi:hypothetical protein
MHRSLPRYRRDGESRLLEPERLRMIAPCHSKTMKNGRPISARGRRPNGRKIWNCLESPAANIGRQIWRSSERRTENEKAGRRPKNPDVGWPIGRGPANSAARRRRSPKKPPAPGARLEEETARRGDAKPADPRPACRVPDQALESLNGSSVRYSPRRSIRIVGRDGCVIAIWAARGRGPAAMVGRRGIAPVQPSPFRLPSSSGSLATLIAIRRASSLVSTFACIASASLSRE